MWSAVAFDDGVAFADGERVAVAVAAEGQRLRHVVVPCAAVGVNSPIGRVKLARLLARHALALAWRAALRRGADAPDARDWRQARRLAFGLPAAWLCLTAVGSVALAYASTFGGAPTGMPSLAASAAVIALVWLARRGACRGGDDRRRWHAAEHRALAERALGGRCGLEVAEAASDVALCGGLAVVAAATLVAATAAAAVSTAPWLYVALAGVDLGALCAVVGCDLERGASDASAAHVAGVGAAAATFDVVDDPEPELVVARRLLAMVRPPGPSQTDPGRCRP